MLPTLSLVVIIALLGCAKKVKNAGPTDGMQKPPTVEGHGSPEAALRQFLRARLTRNADALREVLLQEEYLDRMVQGGPAGKEEMAMIERDPIQPEIRSFKVGHKMNLAGGRSFELTESHVNENRRQLAIGNDPFPFDLVRIDGKWKVNILVGPGEPPPEQAPKPKPLKPSTPKPEEKTKT